MFENEVNYPLAKFVVVQLYHQKLSDIVSLKRY